MSTFIQFVYFLVAVAFIVGWKAMSSPATARRGVQWAGYAMVAAVLVTFYLPGMHNYGLMITAIVIGAAIAWYLGKTVKMTDMPQMVAIYNGMGGGAAAAIAAVEFLRQDAVHHASVGLLAALGAIIGAVAFSGSCVAFAKLQGLLKKTYQVPQQNNVVFFLALFTFGIGLTIGFSSHPGGFELTIFFLLALALGALLTLPIGGADMPVVISLLNAFTGLAVGFEGYVLANPLLIVAGTVVGASGTLLTLLMAKAMNRSIRTVIFAPITGEAQETQGEVSGSLKEYSPDDAAATLRYAQKVIIVPGYGMAVAGAQHKVWEMSELLEEAGVEVVFAIHPVAGRMPGHMNVLLAEAQVPYDEVFELEDINSEFSTADVAFVIGANDVTNPAAKTDPSSAIFGMPILDVEKAKTVLFIKRSMASGYAGVENELFFRDNTMMLFGDAKKVTEEVIKSFH